MKKRLLFVAAIIAALACIFALSVNAESIIANTISSNTYGTVYQLSSDPGLENAHLYASTLNTIEDSGKDTESMAIMYDGKYYYVFPSSYIVDEYKNGKFSFTLTMGADDNFSSSQKGINNVFAEWAEAEGVTLPTFTVANTWGNTKLNELVRFEVPTDVTYFDKNHCLIRGSILKEVTMHDNLSVSSGHGLFSGSASLEKVNNFEKVKGFSSAEGIFNGCSSLVSITLPSDTTTIRKETFCNATAFEGVKNWDSIKNNITSIGDYAFYKTAITSVTLPSVKTIGGNAFAYCASLATIDLTGAPLTSIGGSSMRGTAIKRMVLPETLTAIPQDGFHACISLEYINVPRDCTSIGGYAFNGCSSLATLDMTNAKSLKSTGQHSFSGTKITSLIFPEGFQTFHSASGLAEIYLPNSTTSIGVIQGATFTEFVVPLGVTKLGSKMFDYCASLKTVTIHKGVTSIDTSSSGTFFGTTKNAVKTIIYTGSETDAVVAQIQTALPNATIVFADHCKTYFGSHQWSGNAKMMAVDYFKEIQFADICTRENCGASDIDASKTIGALFTWKGYSCSTYGETRSMTQGFGVNKEAIAKYMEYVPSFEFGLIVAGNTSEDNSAFAPALSGDLCIPQDKLAHDYFDIKINGISDGYAQRYIVFCVYVTEGEDAYYLDNNITSQNVTGISYEEVVKLTTNQE